MITFLFIGGLGIALLLVSLVVGDVLEGALDFGGDLFGGAALAGFLGAFGFGGALAHDASDGNLAVSIGVGVVAGLVIGALVGLASSSLRKGGDESNIRSADLAGRSATVVTAIPVEGYGEISFTVAGHLTKLYARAPGGLPAGTPVTITAVLSPTSVAVEPRST